MEHASLHYVKMNPSGNTTVFILDPVAEEQIPAVARAVMTHESLCAEQVAFCQRPRDPRARLRMQMMGGEFCGNASRSFGAWLAMGGGEGPYEYRPAAAGERVVIEVSGHDGLLTVETEDSGRPYACNAAVDMPLPLEIIHLDGPGDLSIVSFEGIVHVVLWETQADLRHLEPVRELLRRQGRASPDIGLMFYREGFLRPLVCIEAVGSQVWESSCGSGTIALACALAHRRGADLTGFALPQPGGELRADVFLGERGIARARLSGEVQLSGYGRVIV